MFDYIEDTAFMIKNPSSLHKDSLFSKVCNKQCNSDGKLQMIIQKKVSLFSQAYVQVTYLTGHKHFDDPSLHSCYIGISFAPPGTWACGLELLWA